MNILWAVIIGIVAGWIAGLIMKGRGFGIVGNLIVGVVGAVIGSLVFSVLNIEAYGTLGSLAMAVLGAVIFLWLISFFRRAA
jgi:uncharacterized membrane protein YeaQ/YmgE (transglycosylase-associated protein family)